jgi:hypothetical protein
MIDVGRELGYRDGDGICVMLKRLESQLGKMSKMRKKLLDYEKRVQR